MNRKEPFVILSAEAEPFIAGREEGGKGTRYELKIITYRSSKRMSFDYFIIDGKMVPFMMRNRSGEREGFHRQDTLQLVTNFNEIIEYDVYPINRNQTEEEFDRLIWLSFSFQGKPGLKEVENINEKSVKIYE